MEAFRIVGGPRLTGEVRVTGAKNSVLKLMAASLLAEGTSVLHEVPDILDVEYMAELLRRLGCDVVRDRATRSVSITVPEVPHHKADYDLVRKLRASINVLGPLLARCGEADVALPGGDNIGSRGLDMHISGLERLGATVRSEHGFLIATRDERLHGATVWLDFPSVGATENLLMASVLAKGTTVIDNAAREPEIVDICTMLQKMGAQIEGVGTSTLVIEGVEALSPVEHTTVPDRLVVGTWAVGAVMTRGDITIHNAVASHLEIALDKLVRAGAIVDEVPRRLPRRVPRPAARGRRRHAALSGLPDRPAAAVHRAQLDRARRRRWSPRTSSRRGSASSTRWSASAPTCAPTATTRWCAAASRSPGRRWRRPTSAPARASCSRVSWPRAARPCTSRTTSTAGYDGFIDDLVRLGADVSRVDV